jgi:peroxiredoxin
LKKYHLFTNLGNLLVIAAFILGIKGFTIYAGLTFCAAYYCIYYEIFILSTLYQFLSAIIAYCFIAHFLLKFNAGFPFLSVSILLFLPVGLIRSIWLDYFGHTRFLFMEPLTWLPGLAFYIYGNATGHFGWEGWIFPLPALLGTLYLLIGFIFDGIVLKKEAKRNYAIVSGSVAPDFELKDNDETLVKLSNYIGKNVLLVFVRGDWCPFCHMMLRTYQKKSDLFLKNGIHLLVIGPDPVGVNREMAEKLGLAFRMLSDPELVATKLYGLRIENHFAPHGHVYDEQKSVPLPASFLVDKNGIVRYVSRSDMIGVTVSFEEIFPILDVI